MNDDGKRALQPPFAAFAVKIVSFDAVSEGGSALAHLRWSAFLGAVYVACSIGQFGLHHADLWTSFAYLVFGTVCPLVAYQRYRNVRLGRGSRAIR